MCSHSHGLSKGALELLHDQGWKEPGAWLEVGTLAVWLLPEALCACLSSARRPCLRLLSSSSALHSRLPLQAGIGVQALEFVRDLDSGPLAQCPTGARHFAALRKATERLVNSVLQLRQLIQRRRGPNPGDTPRPLPHSDSLSSFTESTTSGEPPCGACRGCIFAVLLHLKHLGWGDKCD